VDDVVSFVLQRNGFDSLNPVQESAVSAGLLDGKSIVVSSPTASGKTLIAEIAMVSAVRRGKKALYVSPLRALTSEHYREFKEKYPEMRVAISTGDFDSADTWAKDYDVIFTVYEKLDSLLRYGAPWISDVGVLVVDEVHEIDSDRGPTIEVLLTRFLAFHSAQIVALSATIPNAAELASWLGAELVQFDWRPVDLREGVLYQKAVLFADGGTTDLQSDLSDDLSAFVEDTLRRGKQVLIFANTRKNAESIARRLRRLVARYATRKGRLRQLSEKVLHALESPTAQCKELAEDVRHGVAFHHAGLVSAQREAVENAFRRGDLLVIAATPTLAAGVNLPAYRVLIHSVKRYGGRGYEDILVREYKQMAGRAGRPKYDDHGEAVILARDVAQVDQIMRQYIFGVPENIYSRLGVEPALRFHTLSLIATRVTPSRDALHAFFARSFYAHQYGDLSAVEAKLDAILSWLVKNGFVFPGEDLRPTDLGRRVAQLYIDPYTAKEFVDFVQQPRFGETPFLFLIANTQEMRPYPSVPRSQEAALWQIAEEIAPELGVDLYSYEFDDYLFLNKLKLFLILRDWVNEVTEDQILERYDVSPGILRAYVTNAEWLFYALEEIAKLMDAKRVVKYAKIFQERVHYGVREELLPLVRLKGIGRVRARKLFNAGFHSVHDIASADPRVLAELIGPKVAQGLLRQLGRKLSDSEVSSMRTAGVRDQTTLDAFME